MKTIIISLLGASTLFFSGCDNTPQGARTPSQRPAQVAMDAAKEQWHHYRAESIRHKSEGRHRESESRDRLANGAYDQYNMYYHRIQIGDFSLIPTAAEEQAIRDAEAADNARRASDAAEDAYAKLDEPARRTLIRRLSLNYTGLPLDIADVEAFVRDIRPDAYQRLVKTLLALPTPPYPPPSQHAPLQNPQNRS